MTTTTTAMNNTIAKLTQIANRSDSLDSAAQILSKEQPRLSKKAAKNVMQDISDYLNKELTEQQLSLFLLDHGFRA